MSDLVPSEELADRLDVAPEVLESRAREGEWIRRAYPVGEWAVRDETGEIVGYEVPEIARRRLGIRRREATRDRSWWSRLFG